MIEPQSKPITDIRLCRKKLYTNNLGDTWDPAWAADGNLWYAGNDGSGWDKACSSNIFFNCSTGQDPFNLLSHTTNCMAEYDGWARKREDGCTWKSSGCVSIDGTLYLALARHSYGIESGDPHARQTAQRASIIKSIDNGQTWTRSAQENYLQPMFPRDFTTPYFIHYGMDGQSPYVDGADQYVYAISNNGFWCNGDYYILGRIERSRMGRLDPADWSFHCGTDSIQDVKWTRDVCSALPIIVNPLKCGETGATYLPAIGRYILVAWHYPGNPNVDTDETHFIYYESPHPWGPWTLVKEDVIRPEGWYCPRVLSKWQNVRDQNLAAILVTGGDYYEMSKYYCFTVVELEIQWEGKFPATPLSPIPRVITNQDSAVTFSGSWQFDASRDRAKSAGEWISQSAGDSFTIEFSGTRLHWYTSKENCLGIASVSIDDTMETEIDLYTYCHVPQYQRFVFDSGTLEPGFHTFRVRVTGKKNDHSTGVGITHDQVYVIE